MKHSCLSVSVLTRLVVLTVLGGRLLAVPLAQAAPAFTLFESGHVRPLALSPNRSKLFAVNTPDNRLEVYAVSNQGLTHLTSVAVGLEPVAVAVRARAGSLGREPSLGQCEHRQRGREHCTCHAHAAGRRRAARHRIRRTHQVPGVHHDSAPRAERAFAPQLTTPGVGRADVWVFNATNLGTSLGGTPLTIINLFSDMPRALAASPDGSTVYAAAFVSGNRTTIVPLGQIPDTGEMDGWHSAAQRQPRRGPRA